MRFCLIGCGKVGVTMAYLLRRQHRLVGIYDANPKALRRGQRILGAPSSPAYPLFLKSSDAVLIAVPDDRIRSAFRMIRPYLPTSVCVIHFSGVWPAEVLPKSGRVSRGAAHPFATFPQPKVPPARHRYPLFIQGDRRALAVMRRLFTGNRFTLVPVSRSHKGFVHLAGVMASNLLVGLAAAARQCGRRAGWNERRVQTVLLPLMAETVTNMQILGLDKALSGPVVRGDLHTVRRHLNLLSGKNAGLREVYRQLSLFLIRYAPRIEQPRLRRLLGP